MTPRRCLTINRTARSATSSHWHFEGVQTLGACSALDTRHTRLISMFRPRVTPTCRAIASNRSGHFSASETAERRQRLIEAQWRIERR
jgi:hypothetical protein